MTPMAYRFCKTASERHFLLDQVRRAYKENLFEGADIAKINASN